MIASHATEFGEIYARPPKKYRDLSSSERFLHDAFFTRMMNYSEQSYLHHLDRAIDDDVFDTHRDERKLSVSVPTS